MALTRCLPLVPMLVFLGCLTGCSSLSGNFFSKTPITHPTRHNLVKDLPFYPQDQYQCGPAALATLLQANGVAVTPQDLLALVYLPERHGSLQPEMLAAARQHDMLSMQIPAAFDAILTEIDQHNPVLVMQNLGLKIYPQWHYAVVKGYDLERNMLVLNSGEIENYEMSIALFLRTWKRAANWAMVVVAPGNIPATASATSYLLAALPLLEHSSQLQNTLLQAGLKHWPEDLDLMMAYGNYLYATGKVAEAETWFSHITLVHKDAVFAYNNLAHIELELNKPDAALSTISKALAISATAPTDSAGIIQTTYQQIQTRLKAQ